MRRIDECFALKMHTHTHSLK